MADLESALIEAYVVWRGRLGSLACDRDEKGFAAGYRAALAAPATVGAVAMREACAALFDPLTTDVEIRRKLGREGMKEAAAAIRALPIPAPPASGAVEAREAIALLADARKCVAIVNTNGYYDTWLARCDRILAAQKTAPVPAPETCPCCGVDVSELSAEDQKQHADIWIAGEARTQQMLAENDERAGRLALLLRRVGLYRNAIRGSGLSAAPETRDLMFDALDALAGGGA